MSDSPILLAAIYGDHLSPSFSANAISKFKTYDNVNFFLERKRDSEFSMVGRIHDLQASKEIDEKIKDCLLTNGIPFYKINRTNFQEDMILKVLKGEYDEICDFLSIGVSTK